MPGKDITRAGQGLSTVRQCPSLQPTIGCKEEIVRCCLELQENNFTLIQGRAGIGKSQVLASLLADYPNDRVLCLDCERIDSELDDVIWNIAAAINDVELVDFVEICLNSNVPRSAKLDRLYYSLAHLPSPVILCFDNVQAFYEDQDLVALILDLRAWVQNAEDVPFSLILVTQETPRFLKGHSFEFLTGLSVADLQVMLANYEYDFPVALVECLHRVTLGHPRQALLVAEQILQEQDFWKSALTDLEFVNFALRNSSLYNEMMKNSYVALSDSERLVLQAASIFNQPVSLDALKIVLKDEPIRDVALHWWQLVNKFLLQKVSDFSYEVIISPLDRGFYYSTIDVASLARMHINAGDYYSEDLGDILTATQHYSAAGDKFKAATFLIKFADYVDRDTEGAKLRQLAEDFLTLPAPRALPSEIQTSLHQIVASFST